MIEPYKSKSVVGCKKALGQLNKVLGMLENGQYCMDVIQQIRAVEGLLSGMAVNVMDSHLHTCAGKAFGGKDEKKREEAIAEIVKAFKSKK